MGPLSCFLGGTWHRKGWALFPDVLEPEQGAGFRFVAQNPSTSHLALPFRFWVRVCLEPMSLLLGVPDVLAEDALR